MPPFRGIPLDRYLSHDALSSVLHELAEAYPSLCTLRSIGRSHRGRQIWLLELTNPQTGAGSTKPGFYIDANIHAEEISGTSVVLYTAWMLLREYGQDRLATRLLDEQVLYLLPRLNPDGAEIVQTLPFYEWIGNGRFVPGEEQSGPGLHYADVDGNGLIVDMRLPDDAGEWKISQHDDRLMLPRAPDEAGGTYFRVVPEGVLHGWDGGELVVPRPQDGNLNRNYPSNWVPESHQYGSGETPLSEPETAAVVRFILDHPNIAGMQSYHTHSGVILRPWMTEPDSAFLGADGAMYEALGKLGVEETGYPLISVYQDFTPDKSLKRYGSFIDWTFGALGIPTFSTELWDVFAAAGIQREDHYPLRAFSEADQLKLLRWQDDALGGDGFMPWTAFEHPQLGRVEIGGWKRMYTFRNPPPERYLEQMAAQNCRFTLRHAAAAPRLRLRDVRVEGQEPTALPGRPGAELVVVRAVVDNTGFLATNLSAQAIHMQAAAPVRVTLTVPEGTQILQGSPSLEVGHLAGRAGRASAYSRFYDWPRSAAALSWTLRVPDAEATVELLASTPRAGTARALIRRSADGSWSTAQTAVAQEGGDGR